MARSVNKVTLIGIVGNDIELRTISNTGNSAVNVSLATDESYMDRNTGMKVDQTEWHRISAFGKLAEIIHQYVRKGSRIYIEGKLRTREWEKDGVKRYTTEIIANEMMMLDRANDNFSNNQNNANFAAQYQTQAAQQVPAQQPMMQQQPPMQAAPMQQPTQAPMQPAAANPAYMPQAGYAASPMQQQPTPAPAPISQPQPTNNNFSDSFDDDIPF